MPQMAPIWWSTLFTEFIIIYMIIMFTMYSYKNYYPLNKMSQMYMNTKNIDWKW